MDDYSRGLTPDDYDVSINMLGMTIQDEAKNCFKTSSARIDMSSLLGYRFSNCYWAYIKTRSPDSPLFSSIERKFDSGEHLDNYINEFLLNFLLTKTDVIETMDILSSVIIEQMDEHVRDFLLEYVTTYHALVEEILRSNNFYPSHMLEVFKGIHPILPESNQGWFYKSSYSNVARGMIVLDLYIFEQGAER